MGWRLINCMQALCQSSYNINDTKLLKNRFIISGEYYLSGVSHNVVLLNEMKLVKSQGSVPSLDINHYFNWLPKSNMLT